MLDILLVDDEPELRELLEEQLREAGHQVQTATDGAEGMDQLQRRVFDLVICDVRLPVVDGLTLFRRVRKEMPSTEVILMTAYADVAQAVSALKEGAYDYLTKPFDVDELLLQARRINETRALRRELEKARGELSDRSAETTLIGESPAIRRVIEMSKMVAQSDAPVLITGDSGTGKEVVARLIHEKSARRDKPFVAVNCGALAENLIEAELFGHERGAFTGADREREGLFEAAHEGSLFLDEAGEMSMAAQAKLLRVLTDGLIMRIGSTRPRQVNVRLIVATHRDLQQRVQAGLFREDLYYRLAVVPLTVPPLRERREDIPTLCDLFLVQAARDLKVPLRGISTDAMSTLVSYDFPGNVRELRNLIERACILSTGDEITPENFPVPTQPVAAVAVARNARPLTHDEVAEMMPETLDLRDFLASLEKAVIQRALRATNGSQAQVARRLGLSRSDVSYKLGKHNIRSAVS